MLNAGLDTYSYIQIEETKFLPIWNLDPCGRRKVFNEYDIFCVISSMEEKQSRLNN